jgi:hypothetical protein
MTKNKEQRGHCHQHQHCTTTTATMHPPLTLRATARRVEWGYLQIDNDNAEDGEAQSRRRMPHHPPPASRATARGVDHGWKDDDDGEAATTTGEEPDDGGCRSNKDGANDAEYGRAVTMGGVVTVGNKGGRNVGAAGMTRVGTSCRNGAAIYYLIY